VYFFGNFERCGQSAAKLLSKDEGSRIADQSHKVLCGDQILRFGLTLLNHQTRIAPRTATNKIDSFILPSLFCLHTFLGFCFDTCD
jgi:hypothetical protein